MSNGLLYNAEYDPNLNITTLYDRNGDVITSFNQPTAQPRDNPLLPLRLIAKEAGSSVTLTGGRVTGYVDFSMNNREWQSYTSGTQISLPNVNDSVWFRVSTNVTQTYDNAMNFSMTGSIEAWNNVQSLSWKSFENKSTASSTAFRRLFQNCTRLIKAPLLTATTINSHSYSYMFDGCTRLVNAPDLPATTLNGGYAYMFRNCSSLVNIPAILPCTSLPGSAYSYMFYGCSSITKAPELPALTVPGNGYNEMFDGCSSLNWVKVHATDISATYATFGWLNGVAATGDFYCNPNTAWASGVDGIPTGWSRHGLT